MSRSSYSVVAASVFALVAVVHAWRAIQQLPVVVGSTDVPVWMSWAAVAAAGALSIWGFRSRA